MSDSMVHPTMSHPGGVEATLAVDAKPGVDAESGGAAAELGVEPTLAVEATLAVDAEAGVDAASSKKRSVSSNTPKDAFWKSENAARQLRAATAKPSMAHDDQTINRNLLDN